jgi:hypothetical protein
MRKEAAALRVENRAERLRLKAIFGTDKPAEIAALMTAEREAAAERQRATAEHEKQIETKRQELERRHAEALAPVSAREAKMRAQRDRLMIQAAVHNAVVAERGAPALLCPLIEKQLRVVVEDEQGPVIVAADADGKPIPGRTVAQIVAEMKADPVTARAFDNPLASAKPNGKANGHASHDVARMTGADILNAIRRGDLPLKR